MRPRRGKGHEFVQDVKDGLSDTALQEKYKMSRESLFRYKAAAYDILAGRKAKSAKQKRAINGRQFLNDIKSGMDNKSLMVKYDIGDRQLQYLFGRVISLGLTTPIELALWLERKTPQVSRFRNSRWVLNWKTRVLVLSIILAVVAGALFLTNRAESPKQASLEDVLREAEIGGYRLISIDELRKKYEKHSHDLLLLDTRQDWEFRSGHIRGAANFPIEPTWWSRWQKKGALESTLGTDKNRFIVFY